MPSSTSSWKKTSNLYTRDSLHCYYCIWNTVHGWTRWEHTDLSILEVLTALTRKNVVFWYVTLWCSRKEIYRRYEVSAEGCVCVFQGTLNVEEPCVSETSVKLYQTACRGSSWVSVVGIAARLWVGRSGVRIPVGARDFFLFSETPRTTYSVSTWGKAVGAWS